MSHLWRPKVHQKSYFSQLCFLDLQRVGLERPRESFDLILNQLFHIFVIVFCCFPTFFEESGGRVGVGGSTVSEITLLNTKTFPASKPLTSTVRTCFATWTHGERGRERARENTYYISITKYILTERDGRKRKRENEKSKHL